MVSLLNRWRGDWTRGESRDRLYLFLLGVIWLISSVDAWSLALHILHYFRGVPCDAAVTQNALVNILHGHWFRETPFSGPNVLGIHTHFVFLLLAPIYALFPSLSFFLWLQQLVGLSFIWPLYLITRHETQKPTVAFCVTLIALCAPIGLNQGAVPFHPEPFGLPALFWAYYFYLRSRPVAFGLAVLFAVSCGEHAAITFAALGLAWCFGPARFAWTRRYGWLALSSGVLWMVLAMVVLPAWFHGATQYDNFGSKYSNLGVSSPGQFLWWMVTHPVELVTRSLDAQRWMRALWIVGLLLPFAFLSWEGLAILLQVPLYWLMNHVEFYLHIHSYYFYFVFFACLIGLVRVLRQHDFSKSWVPCMLGIILLGNSVLFIYEHRFLFELYTDHKEPAENFDDLHAAFSSIPREAGVYAPHRYGAVLSNRLNMVIGDLRDPNLSFEHMMAARFAQTDVRADQIDYIVVDILTDQCGVRAEQLNDAFSNARHENVQRLLNTGRWEVIWNEHYVAILRRKTPATPESPQ